MGTGFAYISLFGTGLNYVTFLIASHVFVDIWTIKFGTKVKLDTKNNSK